MNELLWWFGQNSLAVLLMIPCVMLACRLFRNSPAVRHLLWLVILVKFMTPPIVVWPWSVDELRSMAWSQNSDVQVAAIEPSPVTSTPEWTEPAALPMETPFDPNEFIPNPEPIAPLAHEPVVVDVVFENSQLTTPLQWGRTIGCTSLIVWLIGALVCLVSQIRRLTRYARLVRSGAVAPLHLNQEVASVASLLRMKPPVSLVVKGIASPFLWCLGAIRLAWPDSMASPVDVARSRGIIAHELAHLRRRDHWITWLELGASILWWWNPLFWFVRRRLRETAEMSCDAMAIAANPESRQGYAELLLQLSTQPTNEFPAPVLAVGAGNARSFERRLKMILSSKTSGNLSLRGMLVTTLLAVTAFPCWSLAQSNPEPNPQQQAEGIAAQIRKPVPQREARQSEVERAAIEAEKPNSATTIEIQVVDAETNQPVSGGVANIRFTLDGWAEKTVDKLISQNQIDLTNDGKFPLTIPDELRGRHSYLQVSIKHPDYVIEQSFGSWSVKPEMSTNPALALEKLFGGGVIELKRGHEISGQVLGPDGKPASGVSLYAAMQMPEYLNMPPHAVTGNEGRYKFRVPSRDGYRLFLISPDAVSVSIPIRKGYGEHPPITLEGGTAISGQVIVADGNPLADLVVQGNGSDSVYTGFPNPMARVKTDAEGRYSLPPMKLPVDVRVAPLGYVGGWSLRGRDLTQDLVFLPKLFKPSPGAPLPNATLDFHPAETVTLTARVYDEQGQPATRCDIALFGEVTDSHRTDDQRGPFWRGRFRDVPQRPGLFQVKAPEGLLNATLVGAEVPAGPRQKWSRAVREGEKMEGPRTDAGWSVLDRDDDSIVVGEPVTVSESRWRRVSPHKVVWNSDRTSQIRQDSSVQLESEHNWQDFTLSFRLSDLPARVQTIRLELLPSPNSRATSDSNVMLFDVKPHLEDSNGKITQLEFDDCKFAGKPDDDSAANCIDSLSDTGWKVPGFSGPDSSHQLVLKLAEPILLDDGEMFGVTIDAGGSPELGTLSRVRVSFADTQPTDVAAAETAKLRMMSVREVTPPLLKTPTSKPAEATSSVNPTLPVNVMDSAGTRVTLSVEDVEFAFRWCPAGEFKMGASKDTKKEYGDRFVPQGHVSISAGFWLQETEVTQSQYKIVMGENPSFWNSDLKSNNTSQHPVEQVTWSEAMKYCERLSKVDGDYDYRLPTEAEWEYACRAGTTVPRYGDLMDIAWVFQNTEEDSQGSSGHRAVGLKKPNAWGLYDMLGNVAEWCSDWYGPRGLHDSADPTGPQSGSSRVVRGDDCFADCSESMPGCLAGARHSWSPGGSSRTIGFRVVRIPATAKTNERD